MTKGRCKCEHRRNSSATTAANAGMTLEMSNNTSHKTRHQRHHYSRGNSDDDVNLMQRKLLEAQNVETQLSDSVNLLNRIRQRRRVPPMEYEIGFPSVRQCNAALATFGDAGEFSRALKLFVQMKKAVSLSRLTNASNNKQNTVDKMIIAGGPKPTLVTYSTLMSRAVSMGKPKVALRLWNLMKNQPNFYTNLNLEKRLHYAKKKEQAAAQLDSHLEGQENGRMQDDDKEDVVIPDVIFCNTLMNAYAKLGDHTSSRSILNAMLDISSASCHEGIPITEPTVVTYNTLADACKVAGELGAGLEVLDLMTAHARAKGDNALLPDARTYTILISAVARKKKNGNEARDLRSGGENDPDMAFVLLKRMIDEGITPNGMTFCALIDVCSRCHRIDLALNGLQVMLKQKSKATLSPGTLFNEVGAWTSAINACGKSGRTDTAVRLFRTMQKFGVKPNSVTCGCLADCLLKATPMRMTETLEVLQYMKNEGLVPGEVMYTSLMGIAMSLTEDENKSFIRKDGLQVQIIDKFDRKSGSSSIDANEQSTPEAILLYTELMRCLIHDGNDNMLLKVFLVYQEMRNAGVKPDVTCYNTLLRACALSGDIEKTQDVLLRMIADGVEPTRNTWRGTLKATRKARRSDIADFIWDFAVRHQSKDKDYIPFIPTTSDVELLMSVYVNELGSTNDHEVRCVLNKKIMGLYEGMLLQSDKRGLHHIHSEKVEENEEFMLAVLRAAVSFELHGASEVERTQARNLACDIAGTEILQGRLGSNVDRASKKALQIAQGWLHSY